MSENILYKKWSIFSISVFSHENFIFIKTVVYTALLTKARDGQGEQIILQSHLMGLTSGLLFKKHTSDTIYDYIYNMSIMLANMYSTEPRQIQKSYLKSSDNGKDGIMHAN